MMKHSRLLYIELKTGFADNGPAWIGRGYFSRTGRTLYFNDMILQKAHGATGNFLNIESGEEYWVSGAKQNEDNRLNKNPASIGLDSAVLDDYLRYIGQIAISKTRYYLTELINEPAAARGNTLNNSPS